MSELPFVTEWDRSRYSSSWLQLCIPEENVEKTVLEKLRYRGVVAQKIDAGGKAIRGKLLQVLRRFGIRPEVANKIAALVFGAAPKGWLDITGVMPGGRAVFIEVKRPEWLELSTKTGRLVQKQPPGKPEPEQIDFMIRMYRQGAVVGIVWAPEDLDRILGPK